MKKNVVGTAFTVKDSLRQIDWKLTNEFRIIAGFNCKKAIGRINDSVYVFVFYSEEIMIPGGPCSIHGLPGMILGMTIPRLYTSWIATKINVQNVDDTKIKNGIPAKRYYTDKEFTSLIYDRAKEWGNDEESKKWVTQFIWSAEL